MLDVNDHPGEHELEFPSKVRPFWLISVSSSSAKGWTQHLLKPDSSSKIEVKQVFKLDPFWKLNQ